MLKTIIYSALYIVFLMSSAAAHGEDDPKYFHGFYVGGEVGRFNLNSREELDGTIVEGIYASGMTFSGVLGYRYQYDDDYLLGLEGSFGGGDVSFKKDGVDFLDIDIWDNHWSIAVSMGKVVGSDKRSLIYLGGGYAKAKFALWGYSESFDDVLLKVGYEYAISKAASLRIQAQTMGFDSAHLSTAFLIKF